MDGKRECLMTFNEQIGKYEDLTQEQHKEYLALYKAGDTSARNKIIESVLKYIYREVNNLLNNKEDFDEVLSAVTLKVINSIDKWDGERPLIPYIKTIIRNSGLEEAYAVKNQGRITRCTLHSIRKVKDCHTITEVQEKLQTSRNRAVEIFNAKSFYTPKLDISNEKELIKEEGDDSHQACIADIIQHLNKLPRMQKELIEVVYGINRKADQPKIIKEKYGLNKEQYTLAKQEALQRLKLLIEGRELDNDRYLEQSNIGNHNLIIEELQWLYKIIVKKYYDRLPIDRDEIQSICNLVLVETVKSWNHKHKLVPLLICKMKNAVIDYCFNRQKVIRVPRTAWKAMKNAGVKGINVRLISCYDNIAMKDRSNNVIEIAPNYMPCLSYIESLLDIIPDKEQRKIFSMRYGLGDFNAPISYIDISKELGIEYEQAVQSVARTITAIRNYVDPNFDKTRKCERCGVVFVPYRFQKYCSRNCAVPKKSEGYGTIECKYCKKVIVKKRSDSKYCSKHCKDSYINSKRN